MNIVIIFEVLDSSWFSKRFEANGSFCFRIKRWEMLDGGTTNRM